MNNMEEKKNWFEVLNGINVSDKTETIENRSGLKLTYLSWAWAVTEITKLYPDFIYEVERFDNLPYIYDCETGYMVFTKVTIEGITKEMWLPVMDSNNKAMLDHSYEYDTKFGKKKVEKATMFDINKTIMRCLTKNISMFGLGLYIYAGEDLPEGVEHEEKPKTFETKDKDLELQIKALEIYPKKVAIYLKKEESELTDEEMWKAVNTKKEAIAKQKEKK